MIDDVRVCYHDDNDGCNCRKPSPGMLIEAARELDIDLGASFLVGDRWRDIEAARRAGCRPIFVDHAYAESGNIEAEARVDSLISASLWIQSHAHGS
jgi:D-glycero-D-manno-heptose 1,7-bisphosphate phosphatase